MTTYKKESHYWFSSMTDQGGKVDQSIKIRFNDGGHARLSGSVRWKMPLAKAPMIKIHTLYGSQQAVEQNMVRTVIEKCVYMTGPLMSSKESYAERRNDLISYISDQAAFGVYKTVTTEKKGVDLISGKDKTYTVVELMKDTVKGTIRRQEKSPLYEYGIAIYNLSINKVRYDDKVEAQIAAQQQAIMDVQTAMAQTKKAEQNAIKVEKQGEAQATEAKWEQEVKKARAVTEAEQKKEVALLNMEAAVFTKKKLVLEGEGLAAKKRLIMQADGALSPKLDAWVKVNQYYAKAISNYKGNWVSTVNMGGGTGRASTNAATDLIELLKVKTAMDLSLDMDIRGRTK